MDEKHPDLSYPADIRTNLRIELEQLTRLVRERVATTVRPGGTDVLVVTRVVAGLPMTEWERLTQEGEFGAWFAFSLAEASSSFATLCQNRLEEVLGGMTADPMTGLGTREAFVRDLDMALAAASGGEAPLSLALLSTDDPLTLQGIGDALRRALFPWERGARIGQMELALLIPGIGINAARLRLEELLAASRSPHKTEQHDPSLCTGIVFSPARGKTPPTELLRQAEKALAETRGKAPGKVLVVGAATEEAALVRSAMVQSEEKRFLFAACAEYPED